MLSILLTLVMLLGAPTTAAPATAAKSTGAAIDAVIRGTTQPLEVQLLIEDADADDQWRTVARRKLAATERRVAFEALAPGVYQLLLLGPQSSEQFATKVVLGTGNHQTVNILVRPVELSGRVLFGETPVGSGTLILKNREFGWRGGAQIAADGSYRVPLWQRGAFTYTVRAASLASAYSDVAELEGSPIQLDVHIPDGRVTGIVRDGKSGAPVGGVMLRVHTKTADGERNVTTKSDANGKYDIVGLRNGRHELSASSARHVQTEAIAFELGASSRQKQLDVKLDPGHSVPVVVIDSDNDAVARAVLIATTSGRYRSRVETDADGRANVAIPDGEATAIYAIQQQGSFGVLRLSAREVQRTDAGRRRIELPAPVSSLNIIAKTTAGDAMPPFSLLMRFNGELVPIEVADELAIAQGLQLGVGTDGEAHLRNIPRGAYEFWPYRTEEEADAIVASADAFAAPIQVNVKTGENRIAVKFARR